MHMHRSPHSVNNPCLDHVHILASLQSYLLLSLEWNSHQLVPQALTANKGAYSSSPLQQFQAFFSIKHSQFEETNSYPLALGESVMKPAQEKIEKIDQRLRIQPLRGGNLLYIT